MDTHTTDFEILAVVDESDIVIGSRTRRDIHREGLRHRAVHILVFDGGGKICLQKRSMSKDVNPGAWDTSAAGHVDLGENYQAAAERELSEELSIQSFEKAQFIAKIDASAITGWEFIHVFAVRHHGPLIANPDEIDELRWLTFEELDALLQTPDSLLTRSFRTVIASFLDSELCPTFFPKHTD